MKALTPLFLSLAIGVAVGLLYALVKVRSPAPPIVALVGLLGMVLGEAAGNALRQHVSARAASQASSAKIGR